ncbi:hypothetical protein [Phormidesmis priestleyi]|uniref:hypothetical protein n=1 Tax=Phormidesmis priestleyi TaxID=268141 RepID=UPI0009354266|nr:hypothetical protein [Phormidesmis priestleyi]
MTSNVNPQPSARTAKASGQPVSSASAYSPSVPISLYREVTAELQASRSTVEALKAQNQQLAKQNNYLRQEVEKAALTTLHLRQVVSNLPPVNMDLPQIPRVEVMPDLEARFSAPPAVARPPAPPLPKQYLVESNESPLLSDHLVFEQESQPRRKIQADKRPTELNGWLLGLIIVTIVITAFGTGFLIVRPLLPSGNK